MTKLHGVRNHPFRRTMPRMPKASHILWILVLGLLLLAILTFWSHSAAAGAAGETQIQIVSD